MSDLTDIELQKKLLDNDLEYDLVHISEPCQGFSSKEPKVMVVSSPPCQGFSLASRRRLQTASGKTCKVKDTRRGCNASGPLKCIGKCMLISMIVFVVMTLLAAGGMYFWTKNVVQHLTVTESKTFPIIKMSDAEIDYFGTRIKLFFDELRLEKEPKEDLIITQDEINGALGHSDYLAGNMYVTLSEGKIFEEYSLPMEFLPGGHGRYFVGSDYTAIDEKAQRVELKMETAATHEDWFIGPLYFLQVHFEGKDMPQYHQHLLELIIENGSFFGNAIPDDFIDQHMNILEGAYSDPESGEDVRAVINGIESVTVEEGRIVIKPRRHNDEGTFMEEEGVFLDEGDDTIVFEEHDPVPDGYEALVEREESDVEVTSTLRATKIEPARPRSAVQNNLRVAQANP